MLMVRYRLLLILIFVIPSTKSFTQFNDSVKHYIYYSTTGILNKTSTTNSWVLSNVARFNYKENKISFNSNASYIYGEQQKSITNRDFSASADFNYYPKPKHIYYWGLVNYVRSYSLNINHRFQGGIGAAYNVIDKPGILLNISDGILYEDGNIDLTDSTSDKYSIARNSLRIRYTISYKDIIVLNGSNFFQNALSDGNDYIIQSTNTLSIKLKKWLSFTTAATYNKVQRTHRENLLLTLGLTAEKYF